VLGWAVELPGPKFGLAASRQVVNGVDIIPG
jgi:hypothetical protein